jgi:hypothetical protein
VKVGKTQGCHQQAADHGTKATRRVTRLHKLSLQLPETYQLSEGGLYHSVTTC